MTKPIAGALGAIIAVAGALALGGSAGAAAPDGHPVAVELFTSQGCSSCPPADAVMAKLAREPGVVAISRPVTYWDRLGWKDTLAMASNTRLQQGYTGRKIPGAGVYTPQSVVQGRAGAVGGQEARIRTLVREASRLPEPALSVQAQAGGGKAVALDGKIASPATVSLVALKGTVPVTIGSGENGGRKIVYSNVLVDETPLGRWTGGAARFAVPAAALATRGADRYALLVRQGDAGPILAARYL